MRNDDERKKLFFGLYNSVQPRLSSFLLAFVHNQIDADDILQETAIVLWDKFDQFQEGTNFGAWAVKIASYKALEFLRKNRKTKMFFNDDFYEILSKHAQEDMVDVSDRMEALRICLEKVPENSKKLLLMRYKNDIPIKRISQLTGRSANGLYQSFGRIVTVIRECMNKQIARWAEI